MLSPHFSGALLPSKLILKELNVSPKDSLEKVSLLLIPTIVDPSPTMKSKSVFKRSLDPLIIPFPQKSGLGFKRLERELTPRTQVMLTSKNSTNSPTLS